MKHGLLLVDKQPGGTSHDVVQGVRRLFRQKKVGHCGTLDPDATGLLLLTLGQATRLTRFLIQAPKVYEGTIAFGVSTDTYDAAGQVTARRPVEGLTRERVQEAMEQFTGTIEQTAPPFSAKKIKGVKFYELARRGEEVPREAKTVTVFELKVLGELEDSRLGFRLSCSSGTYARTVAHDLGEALGTGAHLAALRRLQIGSFSVDAAVGLDELGRRLEAAGADADPVTAAGDAFIPFDTVPLPFGEMTVDAQQEKRIEHGQTVLARDLAAEEGDWLKLTNRRRRFIAVGTVTERIGAGGVGIVQPRIVFQP